MVRRREWRGGSAGGGGAGLAAWMAGAAAAAIQGWRRQRRKWWGGWRSELQVRGRGGRCGPPRPQRAPRLRRRRSGVRATGLSSLEAPGGPMGGVPGAGTKCRPSSTGSWHAQPDEPLGRVGFGHDARRLQQRCDLGLPLLHQPRVHHRVAHVRLGRRAPVARRVLWAARELQQHVERRGGVEDEHQQRGDVAEALVVVAVLRPHALEQVHEGLAVALVLEGPLSVPQEDAEGRLVVAHALRNGGVRGAAERRPGAKPLPQVVRAALWREIARVAP
jgi:hypothetical protein